jgi:hypothetical protein
MLRGLASSFAAFLAIVHLFALFHFALVPHRVCAEHQHLEHASHGLDTADSRAPFPEVRGASDEPAHDHCLSSGVRDEPSLPMPTEHVQADCCPATGPSFAESSGPLVDTDILSIAPKQSPPIGPVSV